MLRELIALGPADGTVGYRLAARFHTSSALKGAPPLRESHSSNKCRSN
jgi:hypothetical protein